MVSLVAWPRVHAGTTVFVAVGDSAAEQAMRTLSRFEIMAGESGAAGLAGLVALASAGEAGAGIGSLRDRSVLLLCTEGATDAEAYDRIVRS
jgi:diaminopropionate ammonia-lyase